MKRRESDQGDSFDLFLDTICNTFGGIVFLAILVALLARIRHDPSGSESADQPVTALTMRTLELEFSQQQSRLLDLQSVRDATPEFQFDSEVSNLVDRRDELEDLSATEKKLIEQRQQLGKKLMDIAAETATIPEQVEQAEKELEVASVELATAKAEWQIVRKEKSKTMQVPLERRGAGTRGIILLSGEELFLVASPDDEKGDFFDKHVISAPIPGTGSDGYRITPRYGKGITLGSEKSIIAIRETARRLSREDGTLIIAVYPDSYHHFGPVRDAFKSFGMNYDLWVQGEGEPLEVVYGNGRSRVQ
ncbi:hypothetical protein [Aporhodopirellula aestuarii]|uniref:Uncharacterized protein n=1 Tax=Aporhodopirellula aestuarii TaxID=2950107 RepID=A0ABT0U4Q5_9BACT|nr:hypothetical protein [Aporhodopirellula aestuarii]MCM2371863.1 hypothetical protein [Aporhodopirellula aestuarii]